MLQFDNNNVVGNKTYYIFANVSESSTNFTAPNMKELDLD
jgi:hypothetical protein